MTPKDLSVPRSSSVLPILSAALAAVGLVSTAHAQVQVAGTLLVDVNAATAPLGSISDITNNGTMGGFFEARGGGTTVPVVMQAYGNGTQGIFFDGGDYMQHVSSIGGALVPADPTLTGVNPTLSIEVWALNPGLAQEETMVSWGHRGGGPDGSNMSFNYGWDAAWGAIGHWGSPDLGWDPSDSNSGDNPLGNPQSGVWHHLVYTFDGTTQKVYSDGVLKNTEAVSLNIFPNPAIMLGAQYDNDTVVTGGLRGRLLLSQLRVHSEALTASQISNNYNFESSNYNNLGSPLPFHPAHRYSFSHAAGAAPDGTPILDSEGTADGAIRGAGATFTGTRVTLPGGASATQGYIDLPNGLLSTNSVDNGGLGQVTIEGWMKITGAHTWSRIFDFGSTDIGGGVGGEVTGAGGGGTGMDYLFLSAQDGDNVNNHVIDIRNADGTPSSDPAGPSYASGNFNRDFHFALTWDEASGVIVVYENGAAVDGMSFDPSTTKMSYINDVNVWLGRSQWAGDQNVQGEYDEFRIYSHVLTPQQVRASYLAGPDALATADPASISLQPADATAPEFGSASFTASAQGALPISKQWYKNDVLIPGQTGNTLTLTSLPFSDNGAQIYLIASNNIGGTAYTATTRVATLTVLADTNPPTLLQVRLDSSNTLELIFSERIRPDEATNIANYLLTGPGGVSILSASFGSDALRVYLTLSSNLVGCEFYSITASNIHDLAAGSNFAPAGTSSTIWNLASSGLTHRYNFNVPAATDATGAAVPDVISGADGTVRNGLGTTRFTGSRVTLSGGSSAVAPYVDLPNGLLSLNSTNNGGSGQLTFEGWVKVTGNNSWSRFFDFGSSGPCCAPGGEVFGPGGADQGIDYFFYSAEIGTDVGHRRIDLSNRDQGDHGTVGAEFSVSNFNQDVHYVVTWDETTGRIVTYENGVQVASMNTVAAMSEINDVNVWLGRSNWGGDGNMQGEYDEFRVYNTVLSPKNVLLNQGGGPDNNFGALLGLNLVPTTNSMFTNTIGTLRVLANFARAGTQDVAESGCVVYSTTDSNIVYITSDGVIHAVEAGTGTVSVALGGLIDSKEIVVSADSIPPTVLRVRPNSRHEIEIVFSEPVSSGTAEEYSNYIVSSPSGYIDVLLAQRLADQSHVILTLGGDMPNEYITVNVSSIEDQSPLQNQIVPVDVSFMFYQPAGLRHRYTFNNTAGAAPNTAVVPDTVGTADAIIQGSGAAFSGDRVTLPGGSSASAAYVDLPNGLLSTNAGANGGSRKMTLEGWVKVTGNHTWARIFDFGSSGVCCTPGGELPGPGGSGEGIDYLMYSAQVNNDLTVRRFELQNRDQGGLGNFTIDHPSAPNHLDHFACTWDEASGRLNLYENGVLVSSVTTAAQMSDINDVNVWLGRSTWTGDQNLQGEFDEFRIYDRIISTNEIATDIAVGPDYAFGAPLAVRIAAASPLQFGQTAQPIVIADFSTVSNVDLTAGRAYSISSSDPSIISVDSLGVLHAIGNGTVTITANFSGRLGTTSVTATGAQGTTPGYVGITPGSGNYTISFQGTPGTTYRIQRTTDLTEPIPWTTISTQTAPPNGVIATQDANPPAGQAFYRAVSP